MATWTPYTNSVSASPMWLLGDGRVLGCTNGQTLQFLKPDAKGSYANGKWTAAGQFLLVKDNFASAVLPDGRLVACGGEQSGPGLPTNDTNFCEIYDPLKQLSTQFQPPTGWANIGDAPSVVLTNGTYMLGSNGPLGGADVALLNASTLTWTFGGGDSYIEQGYVLLQNGDVLTASTTDKTSKRYVPSLDQWVQDANMPVLLGDSSEEIGPGIAMMDGRVIWFGATGHTCIYTPGSQGQNGTWTQGPDMLAADGSQLVCTDSTAVLEPNGKVFVVTWSGTKGTVVFGEYDPTQNKFSVVDGAPSTTNREAAKMLLLPNGHGMVWIAEPTNVLYDVQFDPGSQGSWAPKITSFPSTVGHNQTVTLSGTQLCGLSECQHFGDDNQQAENYPTVRFIDGAGEVTYVRAHDVSTRSIAPGQSGSVQVDIPASLAFGTYSVEAVAMGIASNRVTVDVVGTVQLFYRGADNGLWSRWRNPDGSWSNEQSLGGQLLANPVAAVVPGTEVLQLFYAGTDRAIWTRWRNADGSWSGEQRLGGEIAVDSIVATTIPGTNILQLFYVGTDDAIWSRWRDPNETWSSEQRIGGLLPVPYLIAHVVPGTDVLQLFYVGADSAIYTRWRNTNGSWSAEQRLGGTVDAGARLTAATVPNPYVLQLFYRGTDGTVWSRWRNANGTWSAEQHIGGSPSGDPVAAIVPGAHVVQLFYQGTGNAIWSRWRNPDGSWSAEQRIGGGNVAVGGSLAGGITIIPGTNVLQIFYVGTDDGVWSLWRNPDGTWSSPAQQIGGKLAGNVIAADLPD